MSSRPREAPAVYRWLWLIALVGLCVRLGYVVAHDPLAGFGNQFDMLRTTGCLGLVPDVDAAPGAATPAGPIERYRVGAPRDASCLFGTEVVLAGAARAIDWTGDALGIGDPQTMPLRLLAWTKLLLLVLAVAWIDLRLRAHPGARVAHLALAALILADPFNTLYLAGFYTEFAALLSGWLALALPLTWLLDGRAPRLREALPWGLILGALALSRFQHLPIPLMMLLWLLLLARQRRWPLLPLLVGPALVLIPALALQFAAQNQYQTIADANRWNSFFGAALPAARDPLEFVRALDLPDHCAELAHTTWYLQRGRDARAECPQAFALSRVRWLLHLAAEPPALARMIGRGVSLSGQWRPAYLGELAGTQWQRLPIGSLGMGASVADGVARMPYSLLLAFWALPLLLLVGLIRSRALDLHTALDDRRDPARGRHAALWLWPMLVLIVAVGWGASLVGDGYSELARHLHLAANASLVALALGLLASVRSLFNTAPRTTMRTRWALALGLIVLLAGGAFIRAQSLAYGVLDQPADERVSGAIELSGWALDPRGIQSVDAVWDDGRRQPLQLRPRPDLVGVFGAAALAVGFRGQLDAPATVGGQLRIEVVPMSGPATVIDRRWLR